MHDRALLGRAGEELVARWYQRHGYQVVARNWRNSTGEIDLVVCDETSMVIVEVKTRRSDRFGSGAEAITPAKQKRLRRLAVEFATEFRAAGRIRSGKLRIDVAVVTGTDVRIIRSAC